MLSSLLLSPLTKTYDYHHHHHYDYSHYHYYYHYIYILIIIIIIFIIILIIIFIILIINDNDNELKEATKFMKHSKRNKLTTEDINNALRLRNVETLYGFTTSKEPIHFIKAAGKHPRIFDCIITIPYYVK